MFTKEKSEKKSYKLAPRKTSSKKNDDHDDDKEAKRNLTPHFDISDEIKDPEKNLKP